MKNFYKKNRKIKLINMKINKTVNNQPNNKCKDKKKVMMKKIQIGSLYSLNPKTKVTYRIEINKLIKKMPKIFANR